MINIDDEAYCRNKLNANPNALLTLVKLGKILREKGELDEAITLFNDAIKIQPYYIIALNQLADIYISQNKYEEAKNHTLQVLKRDSRNAAALVNLKSIKTKYYLQPAITPKVHEKKVVKTSNVHIKSNNINESNSNDIIKSLRERQKLKNNSEKDLQVIKIQNKFAKTEEDIVSLSEEYYRKALSKDANERETTQLLFSVSKTQKEFYSMREDLSLEEDIQISSPVKSGEKLCTNCLKKIGDDEKFCRNCGTKYSS